MVLHRGSRICEVTVYAHESFRFSLDLLAVYLMLTILRIFGDPYATYTLLPASTCMIVTDFTKIPTSL